MTISGTLTTNLSKSVELQRAYQPPQTVAAQTSTPKPALSRRFDSVVISEENSRFAREARSRLAREVRTAAPSVSVSALREEIQKGTYHPDSMETARNILLFGEGA